MLHRSLDHARAVNEATRNTRQHPDGEEEKALRELFIEELAEVKGGSDNPLKELRDKLGGNSTTACCEEGQCCDPVTPV